MIISSADINRKLAIMKFFSSKPQIDEEIACMARENIKRAYGLTEITSAWAQSVAIEYQRLMNMDKSKLRIDEKCSNMGTAGR